MSNGDGGISIGDIFSGLGDVIAAAIQEIIAAVIFLAKLLVAAFVFLFNLIKAVFDFHAQADFGFLDTLKRIWHDILKNVLGPFIALYKAIQAWLLKVLGPIIRWLQKMRAWWDSVYKNVLRPLLNIIQHIRQVLQIFRLFGFKWAKALDKFLGDLQGKLIRNFTEQRGFLNISLYWLAVAINPIGLLRRVPGVASALRSLNPLLVSLTGHGLGYWIGVPSGLGLSPLGTAPAHVSYPQLTADIQSNTLDVQGWRQQLALNLNAVSKEIK